MDEQAAQRFNNIMAEIDAGTSPLTRQDVTEAFMMALFPLDAPSIASDPFAQFLRELTDEENGISASAISFEVILTTLEDRCKSKTGGHP
jgi:hypothetical protein